ncbi:unnamed protein product [Peronospora belbahrii]|uniref:Uncharacterized protein n=1 Tax=Peronospora belbahrii TaxID=622444 RepID=A0AAU9KL57_9STRA|nr:unnamed protein product [Peronospora belbahrii]
MEMSSAPLQVITGRFFRLECNHEQLFQSEYKRSNRTKGLKILRCFPHCCPEHIDRSYCGSSLSVDIRLAKRSDGTAPLKIVQRQVLSVFARFEAVSDVSLRTGECVEVDVIQRALQTGTNLDGQWIAGVLDQPSDMVTMIRALPGGNYHDESRPGSKNSLVFHLNRKACSRWYYDWESGANKAQRLMKHVLKAYIVEQVAVDMDDNFTTISSPEAFTQLYRVLHVVSSPEFTVISYRRAPLDQLQVITHAHAAVQLDKSHIPQHIDRDVTAWRASKSLLHTAVCNNEAKRRRRKDSNDQEFVPSLEDKLFWEHSNAPVVAVSKNMALLLAFVRWVPLRLYASLVSEIVHLIDQTVLELVSTSMEKKSTKSNCFSRLLFQHAQTEKSMQATGESTLLPLGLEPLLRVALRSVLWLYSGQTCHWIRTFFRQNATSVLDKKVMRLCFLEFLRELEERLHTEVLAATTLRRLSNVAEEVLAAVYSLECFHDRRPLVRQILSGQSFAGWTMFVAQMRETYISATRSPVSVPPRQDSDATFMTAYPPHNAIERSWHGEWYLDVDDVQWGINELRPFASARGKSSGGPRVPDVSLFSLVKLISQIVRFDVAVDIRASTLRIRVPRGLAGCIDCMHLVLDGKDRVFRTFPNGITSCGSDGASGDYIGEMRVEDPYRLVIFLQLFNWSLEQGTPSYRVRINIECHNSCRLSVDGDILETTGLSTLTAEKLSCVNEMSLRAKLEFVQETSAQRHHDGEGAPRDTPAAAWTEYGKFHLGYEKMSKR